jgi:hypothetical protein
MSALLCEGLGAKEVYDGSKKNFSLSREKFFLLGDVWLAVMEGEPPSEKSYQHVAFKVLKSDLPEYINRLKKLWVEMKPPRDRIYGEGESLYFYDFENHLFELHCGTLEERLASYTAVQRSDTPEEQLADVCGSAANPGQDPLSQPQGIENVPLENC